MITGDMEMSDIMDSTCWETRLGLGLHGAYWEVRLLPSITGSYGEQREQPTARGPLESYDLSIASCILVRYTAL